MNASSTRVLLLDQHRIERKLLRMAWQIWENNCGQNEVTLIGIATNGEAIANKLAEHVRKISPLQVHVLRLDLSKKSPVESPVTLSKEISGKCLILVDDVANTGRTLLYALAPLMKTGAEKIQIAVLVDREHKSFPITPDIIGHQLATTLLERITVSLTADGMEAFLE